MHNQARGVHTYGKRLYQEQQFQLQQLAQLDTSWMGCIPDVHQTYETALPSGEGPSNALPSSTCHAVLLTLNYHPLRGSTFRQEEGRRLSPSGIKIRLWLQCHNFQQAWSSWFQQAAPWDIAKNLFELILLQAHAHTNAPRQQGQLQ